MTDSPDAHALLLRLVGDGVLADVRVADGHGAPALLRHAGRREAALLRTRVAGAGAHETVRTAPPVTRSGAAARARRWLAGGAVVSRASGGGRPVDAVAAAAGLDGRADLARGLRVGSGGAVLLLGSAAGRPAVLRVAEAGTPGDPRDTAAVLERLATAGVTRVPEPLGTGVVDDLAWSLESRLLGTPAQDLGADLLDDVADFCAGLPGTDAGPDVPRLGATVATIAAALGTADGGSGGARGGRPGAGRTDGEGDGEGDGSALVDAAHDVEDALRRNGSAVPAGTAHGDLWTGNLLVRGGRLSGVVDWDGATAAAVRGTDVLHAVATTDRMRHRRSLGAETLARPWRQGDTAAAFQRALARAGVRADADALDVIALAWWARVVTTAVDRTPALARDLGWVVSNVHAVLERRRTTFPGAFG